MKILAIISLVAFCYSVIALIIESYKTFKHDVDDDDHINSHLSILLMIFIMSISFVVWLFEHKGFEHGFYQHLINESLWGFLILKSYAISMITRHFRKERTGENFVLCIKSELGIKQK